MLNAKLSTLISSLQMLIKKKEYFCFKNKNEIEFYQFRYITKLSEKIFEQKNKKRENKNDTV